MIIIYVSIFLVICIVLCIYFFQKTKFITLNDKPIFFIHIPKTGGTFVENYLKESQMDVGRFDNILKDRSNNMIMDCSKYHIPPKYFPSIDFKKLHIFTVIRHPIERIISEYNYQKTFFRESFHLDINQFVKENIYKNNFSEDCHFIPQHEFITDSYGNQCEMFLRFEHLTHDLKWYCRQHNIPIHDKKVNKLKSKSITNQNEMTEETKQLVLHFYKKDLELWKQASTNVIYIYWDTGFKNAPEIVKICLQSWKIMNPTWILVELNRYNLCEYISKTNMQFLQKQESKMTKTSFSDLIRLCLLKEHGGLWVDATLFCMKPLNDWIHDSSSNGFFAFDNPLQQISSFFLYSHIDSPIIVKWFKEMKKYWMEREEMEEYFWTHELFRKCYQEDEKFQKNVDKMTKINTIPLHDYQKYGKLNLNTPIQKLTYKKKIKVSIFQNFLIKKKIEKEIKKPIQVVK